MAQNVRLEVTFPFHVVVYPAPDLPGQWIAHFLEFDLIAQGDTKEEAADRVHDAFQVTVLHNLEYGLVPFQARFAPRGAWEAAGLKMPDAVEIKYTHRTTAEPSETPFSFEGVPSGFETIVADHAPAFA